MFVVNWYDGLNNHYVFVPLKTISQFVTILHLVPTVKLVSIVATNGLDVRHTLFPDTDSWTYKKTA